MPVPGAVSRAKGIIAFDSPAGHYVFQFCAGRSIPAFEKSIRVSLGTSAEMREFWRVWDLMPGHPMSM
jgi:hypothetical protein